MKNIFFLILVMSVGLFAQGFPKWNSKGFLAQDLTVTGDWTFSGTLIFSSTVTFTGSITGDLTVDSPTFFVDATNNRVGIGTITPAVSLHIVGGNQRLGNGNYIDWGGTNTRIVGNTNVSVDIRGAGNLSSMFFNADGATVGVDRFLLRDVNTGITAGTTQTQAGATALTTGVNEVSTCANANDGVKLPSAIAGMVIRIINNGAQNMQIWPNTDDDVGAGANNVDANVLAAGANRTYVSYDATNWETM